jgi:DNA modification methylase
VAYSKEANIFQDSEEESNNHPTLKPIALNQHFLSLLRLPQGIEQTLYIPFCGSGSEIIGAIKAGYNPANIIAVEINPNFVKIAKARIAYFTKDKNAIGMFE